jgi:aminoglycoside/choline kinase family phosphotransferase
MIEDFLAAHGWNGAALSSLSEVGASLRRYQRVTHIAGRTAILGEIDNPELEIIQFSKVAAVLRSMGLSVPEIYAHDTDAKLILQEDFGDWSYARLIGSGESAGPYYLRAVDVLVALQLAFKPDGPGVDSLPNFDFLRWHSILSENLKNFYLHYLPCVGSPALSKEEEMEYWNVWKAAYTPQDAIPQTLLMRDFKPANLMHLPDRTGIKATGLIDFQDAGVGSPFYDLIELTEPWRSPLPADLREAVIVRYAAGRPEFNRLQIESGIMMLGAMRWVGWLSNCARYARQGRPQFLAHIPNIWRAADKCLADPSLSELKKWFEQYAPRHMRAPERVAA